MTAAAWTPDRGQIVWVNFNPQKGHEQAGRLPALVISPAAYNAVSNCVLVCPITTNLASWPWKVMLPEAHAGEAVTGAILVDQVKSIDDKAPNIQDSGQHVESAQMDEVLARLATLTG
jgi:mRNA interferase MazF